MKKNERYKYIDVIRLICSLWIFFTHFLSILYPRYLSYWYIFPTNIILGGLTGKLALAFIAVILGYLASFPRNKSTLRYAIERYLFFLISCFVINFIYYIASSYSLINTETITLNDVFVSSIRLDDSISGNLWCMNSFLLGSIICFANQKISNSDKEYIYIYD